MKFKILVIILAVSFFIGCKNKISQNAISSDEEYEKTLIDRENKAAQNQAKSSGLFVKDISFQIKADKKDFEDGIQPWVNIEKSENELPNLINKDEIVIAEEKITVVIDYPLTNIYKFDLKSKKGFNRELLVQEITKEYQKLYQDEEKSATIKTVPMKERKMYNRNQTNGKYGIWGHDLADLALSSIQVYKENGNTILTLGIES
ncbi:hypothetical protein HNP37_002017 [Flavobacterium nitrogenifigens]|uniref:Lipoprotein n=2 Tax=Flavobacterium TaxID=237 RepID=A0A7W7IWN4_9FLAO|nr:MULTISPECIES: hypothetical protein [Flavobacterium]MBB4801956.1 hypothetical protein [Flavobacterium nitrogenifigens]MBB6386914.1 hypothetical protein [Flavobacterium notoginsengisoli]